MASSTVKQHIAVALDEGIDAGFDSWYDSLVQNTNDGTNGLPQLRTLLAEVKRVGKKRGRKGIDRSKQVEFYCNKYADDLAQAPTRTATPTTGTPNVEAIVQAAVQAALAGIAGTTPVTPEVEVEDDDEDERPTYSGKDPDAPATSGQLWRLNTLGHFDHVITKAEAFEIIADALDES